MICEFGIFLENTQDRRTPSVSKGKIIFHTNKKKRVKVDLLPANFAVFKIYRAAITSISTNAPLGRAATW